jgi:hypothetical protein
MVLHHRASGKYDSVCSKVACPSEFRLLEVGEPLDHLLWFGVREKKTNLAFDLLPKSRDQDP